MGDTVRVGDPPSPEELDQLAAVYRYGRYCENPRIPLERSRAHQRRLFQEALQRDDTVAVTYRTGSRVRGLLIGRDSAWDREHFGHGVAVVEAVLLPEEGYAVDRLVADGLVGAFMEWCRERAVRFVSARLSSLQLPALHGLEEVGFRYIESYIYNVVDLDRLPAAYGPVAPLRYARLQDRQYMLRYAQGAFTTHRFHADPRVDPEKAESLYVKWIESAFVDPSRHVLVMELNGRPAAFMVYRDEDWGHTLGFRCAALNMGLLDPEVRGRGIGTRFYQALFEHF